LILPVPITLNHAYTNVRVGKRMMRVFTPRAKQWIETARNIANKEVEEQHWVIPEKQQIVAEILTYFPDKRRRDCHTGAKVMFDGLEGIVYDDDKWVLPRYMEVSVDKTNPRAVVKFYVKTEDNQ